MKAFLPSLLLLASLAAQAAPPALPPLPDPLAPGKRVLPAGEPPERLVWAKIPLSVTLPVGRERLVSFPMPIRVGLPPELGGDVLRTQIVDGTIYWVATQEFPAKRIEVQATGSGNIYLLDLSASKSATVSAPVEISVPEAKPEAVAPGKAGMPMAQAMPSAAAPTAPPKEQDYVTLTRMASQHLYAPKRLHRVPEGVHRAGVARTATDTLLRGGGAEATPLVAWRSGSLYVTAVKLRNLTDGELVLDPRRLRGQWITCAFQHGRLLPKGNLRDTTAAYLISAKPYEEALNGG